jgi:AraC-like DNA-binding protein
MRTITSHAFRPIAEAIDEEGADAAGLLKELAGSSSDESLDCDQISLTLVYRLVNAAVKQTGCADLGLRSYKFLHFGDLGASGFPIITSPTLGIALERFVKYLPLLMSGSRILLEKNDLFFRLTGIEETIPGLPAPRGFTDACASLLLGLLHWLAPLEKPTPYSVELPYPEPENTSALLQLFGPNLVFDTAHLTLTFPKELLELKLITANHSLDVMHCEYADGRLRERLAKSLQAQIYRILHEAMTQGRFLTLEMVAVSLGKSRRSLQNSLEKEGTNFSSIQEECRRSMARDLLANSPRSIKNISTTLGFSELSSLHKACLRWFGATPGQFREQSE